MKLADSKSIVLIVGVFNLLGSFSTFGQTFPGQDALLLPSQLYQQNLKSAGNDAYIEQVGSFNDIKLWQQLDVPGEANLAQILQSGNWNVVLISQNGYGNQLSLLQTGNMNRYELINSGARNGLTAIQEGSDNRIIQQLVESDQIRWEVIQQGSGNEIMSILEGLKDSNLKIRQIGDGLRVIVRQSSSF